MAKEKSIQTKKNESYLKYIVSSALYKLENPLLNTLVITRVDCSKGKYDAKVYFDISNLSSEDIDTILKEIKKATSLIMSHTLSISGWFKCPKLVFKPDNHLGEVNRVLDLIKQVSANS